MTILILNGPNLNLLGQREKSLYGAKTLSEIESLIKESYPEIDFIFLQSNHEGDLIEAIHSARSGTIDALIANWGGFTHSSVAIHDALELLEIPKVEVHLSNIHAREGFRETSVTGRAMNGIITGFGADSYLLGVEAALKLLNRK
jgi:3-dehydroquinate dehydratase II